MADLSSSSGFRQTFLFRAPTYFRQGLINGTAHVAANEMFNTFYGQSTDGDKNWFKEELRAGKTAQQVWWQEAHSGRMKDILSSKIITAQGHALTDAQPQTIQSLQDAFGNKLTSNNQFSGALAKASQFPTMSSGSSIGLTVDNIINYFPKIAELGTAAETITVSGIRHLSELGGPLAVVAGVLWPNQGIMPGSEEHQAVLDNLLKEIREKNLREDVKTAIFQHNSDLLDKGNLGSGANPEDKLQVHHIVPVNLDGAGKARSLLVDKWHLSINTLSNASILPQSYHQRVVHGGSGAFKSYSDQVNAVMENADTLANEVARTDGFEAGQAVIRRELREFGRELARDSGDTRAELLQGVISGADILTNG